MNSKVAAGIAVLVVLMMGSVVLCANWEEIGYTNTDEPGKDPVKFIPSDDDNVKDYKEHSLNGVLFEKYGAIMLVVGALMFGAMIAGVCISREEEDTDD